MKTSHPRPSRGGFTIIELMTALLLLSAFAVVATRCLHTTITLYREVPESESAAARDQRLLRQLRLDVFAAGQIASPSTTQLDLTVGDQSIHWNLSPDGTLTRTTPTQTDTGVQCAPAGHFDYTPPLLTLQSDRGTVVARAELVRTGGGR